VNNLAHIAVTANDRHFAATITSVARLIPSASDSRQPYRLSNLLLVTESFTLIAGTSSLPFSSIW